MKTTDISPDDLKVFLQEAETLIESLDEQIVRLEQDGPSDELIGEIFRVAHTFKGSSGMLGLEEMAGLTHAMEDLFDRVRKGTLGVSEEIVDALLQSLDMLKEMKDQLVTGVSGAELDIAPIVAALNAAADGSAPAALVAQQTLADLVAGNDALHQRIAVATERGDPVLHTSVTLAADSDWLAVRCFQLLNQLDAVAEVLVTSPTQAEIEGELVRPLFEALAVPHAGQSADTLREALEAVEEAVLVTVAAYDPAALQPRAGAPTAAPTAAGLASGSRPAASGAQRVEGLQSSVRIDVEQLDALMNMVGELVIDRTRISQLSRKLGERFDGDEHVQSLAETATHLEKMVDALHERMMKVRMLPVGLLFSKFPRLVRDLSRTLNKNIRLELYGEDTEIDRSVIEQIKDPLVHLIRNACDHGVEEPAIRAAAGKPEVSVLRLTATHEQGQIVISLEDDGRGVDAERVKAKAVERGLISAEKAERMGAKEAVELIFEPGLSTAAATTEVSGRGVGMDIVRRDIEQLGGRIDVTTAPGEGTTFRLRLPLTLATFRGLLVGCGRTTYAIPLTYVQETLRPDEAQIQTINQRPVLHLRTRDAVMPVTRLDETLQGRTPARVSQETPYVVVVRASESESDRPVALAVDRLIDQQDIVVKSLGQYLGRSRGIAGASVLGDGQVVLIVDIPTLIKASRQSDHPASADEIALERIAS